MKNLSPQKDPAHEAAEAGCLSDSQQTGQKSGKNRCHQSNAVVPGKS